MQTLESQIEIPSYSLEQSSSNGSKLFEIYEAKGLFRPHKANFLIPHRKDYYMLALVKQGQSKHWVDMVPYVLKPDTFYFSTPTQIHVKEKSEPFTGYMIMFSEEFLALEESQSLKNLSLILNPYNAHELILESIDLAFIEDLMQKLLQESCSKHEYKNRMIQSYLNTLIIYVSRLYNQQYSKPANERLMLKKFRELINDNYLHLHNVGSYAELLNVSAGYLSELIKLQSGKAAIEHIHERILLEAKRLLFHTDCSVKEIAYQLGFEDPAYFSRFFKRNIQSTPLSYRNTRKMYH